VVLLVDQVSKRRGCTVLAVLNMSLEEIAFESETLAVVDREKFRMVTRIQRSSGSLYPVPTIPIE
jgi:hypothetical protein